MDIKFFLTESTFSHDQIRDLLMRALNPGGMGKPSERWTREVYDDYLIYAEGEELHRRAYAIDADGKVTLGDSPTKVIQQTNYVPVSESDYEPSDADVLAALDVLGPDDDDIAEAGNAGNVGTLIRTFNRKWAKGPHPHTACVAALSGKVSDPAALCAWLKDRAMGTTKWRGKAKEAAGSELFGGLLEAVDAEGWNWRAQLIVAGVSANGNEYPLPVLHEAANLYAGLPVFYGRGADHNERERGTASVAGWITEARANAAGIEGVFEINRGKPDVRDSVKHAYDVRQRTGRDTLGFSHVIPRGGAVTEARKPFGRKVTKITKAESVDLVMSPAAGGALIAPLLESTSGLPDNEYVFDALKEAIMDVHKLLAQLREGKKISLDELAFLHESVNGAELAEAIGAGAQAKADAALKPVAPTPPEPAINESRIAELERQIALATSRATLTATLAEAKLPEPMRDAIRSDFDGRLFESADLEARITRDRDIAAKLAAVRPNGLGEIVVTEDQREKHQKAMDGLVWGKRIDGIQPFLTLKEAYMAISGDTRMSYISGDLPRRIIQEAKSYAGDDALLQESITTTTFGDVLGDSIRRRLLQEYGRPDRQTWRAIVNTTPVVDFRTVERTRWGGYGLLPVVAQGAPYQPLTSPGDEKATDSLDKYGGLEDITLETIANDDMGVVRRIPTKLGYAAVDTLYHAIFNTTILNNATASYDSVTLYHASHSNTGTTALGEAGLLAVENAMRDQLDYGNASGLPLGEANMPKILLIPNELRVTAHKLVLGPNAVISAETATTPNMFYNGYQVIVVDDWTDASDWYAFADPSLSGVIEVGFYQGREEPELFVQDAQTVGSMYDADKATFKIRHIWFVMITDHRGTYRQVVA